MTTPAPRRGRIASGIAALRQKLADSSAEKKAIKTWIKENRLVRDKERKDKFWIDKGHTNYVIVDVHDPVARDKAIEKIAEFRHDIGIGSKDDDEERAEKLAERRARRKRLEEKKTPKADDDEPVKSVAARRVAATDRLIGGGKPASRAARAKK